MEELLKKLITRDNIAELCRCVETMKSNRIEMTYSSNGEEDKSIPESVREYNKELIELDEKLLKSLIDVKDKIKELRCMRLM